MVLCSEREREIKETRKHWRRVQREIKVLEKTVKHK